MGVETDNTALSTAKDAAMSVAEPAAEPQSAGLGNLLFALRHHWLIVAVCWPLLMGVAIPAIWLLIEPKFTATALVKVDPVMGSLLDQQTQTMPLFDTYLASQAPLVSTGRVLTDALTDPRVKGLPLLDRTDPVAALRENLSASAVPRTQFVKLEVADPDPQAAIKLADAVLGSYLKFYGGSTEIDEKLEFLTKKETELQRKLDDLTNQNTEQAKVYNATSPSMFEKLRELAAKSSEQTRVNLETIELEILRLEQEIAQLKSGQYAAFDDASPLRQQEAIEAGPVVRSLRDQLFRLSERLAALRKGLTEEAREVVEFKEQIERVKGELDKERARAAEEYVKDQQALQAKLKDSRLAGLASRLQSAQSIRQGLKNRIAAQEEDDKKMGAVDIRIQSIQGEIEKVQKDLAEVEDARKKLEIQKSQPGPGRVSKAQSAEILPEGNKDRRIKLTAGAVAGCLFAALGLGLLRSRFDAHVYAPQQVESQTGLNILGAVPAISELKRGRISQEEFAEAYRLVRVNMLSPTFGDPPRSILVTSAQSGEGKTSLAVSLAVSLAELNKRVLLVDGDVQAPQIGSLLGIGGDRTLADVLCGKVSPVQAAVPSRLPGLDVLVGSPARNGSRTSVDQHTTARLIDECTRGYDYVVVDSSPALGSTDALIWAQSVDSVILSTFVGSSDLRATRHVCHRLAVVGARVLGAVVCNVATHNGYGAYSSYSSYSTGRSRPRSETDSAALCCLPPVEPKEKPAGEPASAG